MPVGVTVAGAVLMLLGQVLFAVAKRENVFFSSTVRIQTERGHRVCDTGLYRLVRHPGYLGMLMSQLAFPLVMQLGTGRSYRQASGRHCWWFALFSKTAT